MKKKILITGSSNGIGAGVAKYFTQKGYIAIVTYLNNKEDGEEVCKAIQSNGGEADLYQLDVRSEENVKNLARQIEEKYGKLDVLLNNAAVDWSTPLEECSFEDWQIITRTKLDGNFLCTKYFLPLLKQADKANLLIIMSDLGDYPDVSDVAYSVATAGTISFMKAMVKSLSKYGIRTNAIAPGATKTNNKYWADLGNTPELWDQLAKENPLGRVSTPEDIAKAAYMLVEDGMDYLNGNILYVTGGGHIK